MRLRTFSLLMLTAAVALVLSRTDGGESFKSGPAPGELLGAPFQPHNVYQPSLFRPLLENRPEKEKADDAISRAGRPHCPVCEFGLDPVVAIFVRGTEDKDPTVPEGFLKKVDDLVEKRRDLSFLHAFAVFLTPKARSSITEKKIEKVEDLVAEGAAREKAIKEVTQLAAPLKHVVVGVYPPANLPESYKIANKPGVTLLYYDKHRVLLNRAYPEGKLKDEEIDAFVGAVDKMLQKPRKKTPRKG